MNRETPYAPNNLTERPTAHYMELFSAADPKEIAARTGCGLEGNTLVFNVLGRQMRMTWPGFEDEGWTAKEKILMLRYALEGRAVDASERFIPYAEFPSGDLYDRNFRARCINRMVGMFGRNIESFRSVCEAFGGRRISGSGEIWELEYIKNLRLRFIIWEGDEEFAPAGQILFSDNFVLTTSGEDRVIVCEDILGTMKTKGL